MSTCSRKWPISKSSNRSRTADPLSQWIPLLTEGESHGSCQELSETGLERDHHRHGKIRRVPFTYLVNTDFWLWLREFLPHNYLINRQPASSPACQELTSRPPRGQVELNT